MADINEIVNGDYFFFYGKAPIEDETAHDLMLMLLQPKRKMFYNRSEGAGVSDYQNYPNALSLQIGLRYDITIAIAYRNYYVTDGSNGTIDRRIASSQLSISFDQDDNGNLDLSVYYFMYGNMNIPQNLSLPVGKV
jgi:hypothetical protein